MAKSDAEIVGVLKQHNSQVLKKIENQKFDLIAIDQLSMYGKLSKVIARRYSKPRYYPLRMMADGAIVIFSFHVPRKNHKRGR